MALSKNEIEALIRSLGVLVVDDSQFMRKLVRNLLLNVGVKEVYEASDGIASVPTPIPLTARPDANPRCLVNHRCTAPNAGT